MCILLLIFTNLTFVSLSFITMSLFLLCKLLEDLEVKAEISGSMATIFNWRPTRVLFSLLSWVSDQMGGKLLVDRGHRWRWAKWITADLGVLGEWILCLVGSLRSSYLGCRSLLSRLSEFGMLIFYSLDFFFIKNYL